MTSRRNLFIGGACLAGAGVAYGLVPRRHVSLLGHETMAAIVPRVFPGWTSRDVTDLVAPKVEGSLASRLYGETVGRVYRNTTSDGEIMMLLAHGDTQSNDLQLHRPEICYPTFGFAISQNRPFDVQVGGSAAIPARILLAKAPERQESIVYWSRLGEYFPLDRKQQQLDRLQTAMSGVVADGLLARFSVAGLEPDEAARLILSFIPRLVLAVPAEKRAALVGSVRAGLLAQTYPAPAAIPDSNVNRL